MPPPLKLPPQAVKEVETVFDKLLRGPVKKLDEEFRRLLEKAPEPKGAPQPKTQPARQLPADLETVELAREDGTRVLKFGDAVEAVYVVLSNLPLWGGLSRDEPPRTLKDGLKWFTEFGDNVLRGDISDQRKMELIAKLMKTKLLSQKRPRAYGTKTGRFRQ